MNSANQISIQLPDDVAKAVTEKLQEVRVLVQPFLFTLTDEQRRALPKMGDKTLAFVGKTVDYTSTNPEFTPSYLVKEELVNDYNVTAGLSPVNVMLQQLQSDVDDTIMMAGSEAYTQSLIYYNAVKNAAGTGQIAAKPIYDDLSKRFPGRKTKKKSV